VKEGADPLGNMTLCLQEASDQPTSDNAVLVNGAYHAPDYSKASGFNVIDFPVHYNFTSVGSAYGMATAATNTTTTPLGTWSMSTRTTTALSPTTRCASAAAPTSGPTTSPGCSSSAAYPASTTALRSSSRLARRSTTDPTARSPTRPRLLWPEPRGQHQRFDFGIFPRLGTGGQDPQPPAGTTPQAPQPHSPGRARPAQGPVHHRRLHGQRRLGLEETLHRRRRRLLRAGVHGRRCHLHGHPQRHLHRLCDGRREDRRQRHPHRVMPQQPGQRPRLCAQRTG
jgi:hypothetical protein